MGDTGACVGVVGATTTFQVVPDWRLGSTAHDAPNMPPQRPVAAARARSHPQAWRRDRAGSAPARAGAREMRAANRVTVGVRSDANLWIAYREAVRVHVLRRHGQLDTPGHASGVRPTRDAGSAHARVCDITRAAPGTAACPCKTRPISRGAGASPAGALGSWRKVLATAHTLVTTSARVWRLSSAWPSGRPR